MASPHLELAPHVSCVWFSLNSLFDFCCAGMAAVRFDWSKGFRLCGAKQGASRFVAMKVLPIVINNVPWKLKRNHYSPFSNAQWQLKVPTDVVCAVSKSYAELRNGGRWEKHVRFSFCVSCSGSVFPYLSVSIANGISRYGLALSKGTSKGFDGIWEWERWLT